MEKLLRGHASWRAAFAAGEADLLRRLAEQQAPAALYVGCSDSRVVPEQLTGASPGDLFVVRNVANAVPPFEHGNVSVGAALEYAVAVLGVPDVIVCGHSRCGGVKAVLDDPPVARTLPSLAEWLDGLAPAIRESVRAGLDEEAQWRVSVEANVLAQLRNLLTYPVVRDRFERQEIHLHGWVYDLAGARLSVYDAERERFVDAGDATPR